MVYLKQKNKGQNDISEILRAIYRQLFLFLIFKPQCSCHAPGFLFLKPIQNRAIFINQNKRKIVHICFSKFWSPRVQQTHNKYRKFSEHTERVFPIFVQRSTYIISYQISTYNTVSRNNIYQHTANSP